MKSYLNSTVYRFIIRNFMCLFVLIGMSGCQNPMQLKIISTADSSSSNEETEERESSTLAERIIFSGPTFSLSWSYDESVDGTYNVYTRPHDTAEWIVIAHDLSAPTLEINNTQLDYGIYDFAVSFTGEDGLESELHSSLDITASPSSGWFLEWKEST